MSSLPLSPPDPDGRPALPDHLPARMLNEYVYCPRLFFYEWVEGLFADSADTVAGSAEHARVDAKPSALPSPEQLAEGETPPRVARSVTLSSDRHRAIAKMDLLEPDGTGAVTPVDYKHGAPQERDDGTLALWPADRAQLGVQALVLRENGYTCREVVAWYARTRQRVRLAVDDTLLCEIEGLLAEAWTVAEAGVIPPPLESSPKCDGCSLVGICLPDETRMLQLREPAIEPQQLPLFAVGGPSPRKPPAGVRPLVAPRVPRKAVYLNTQGLKVGRSGEVLQVRERDRLVQEVRLNEVCQVSLMGNIQVTTQAVQALCAAEVPLCYFSQGGWFYGMTTGLLQKNVFLRQRQFRLADSAGFALSLARALVAGKIRNQRTLLQRNHVEPPQEVLAGLRRLVDQAERCAGLEELLGVEGLAARLYFSAFAGMLKASVPGEAVPAAFGFDFAGRNRRPPRDAVNALLSLAYSVLAKDLAVACHAVGFDPFVGYYHQPRFGRPALALDLMEPFRPLIADSAVLSAVNQRMVRPDHFVQAGGAVALTAEGRKAFFRAYEARMDTLVTHPLFDYRVSYRRLLEIQARLLARVLEGEIERYPVFTTR